MTRNFVSMHPTVDHRVRRKRLSLSIATLFVVSFMVGMAMPSSGYVLNNCRFSGNPVEYKYSSVGTAFQTAHDAAAGRWNSTTGTPDLAKTTALAGIEIWVYDDSYTATWDGLATGGCVHGGYWSNNQVKIEYNLSGTSTDSAAKKQHLATHELGHALGLAHNSNSCTTKSVMRDGYWAFNNCSGTAPYQDDINGKEWIY